MPYVRLQDAWGTHIHVTTTDRELLRAWLAEWLPRVCPPDMPGEFRPLVQLSPCEVPAGSGEWDWLTDSRAISQWVQLPGDDPDRALEFLDRYRAGWTPEKWKGGEIIRERDADSGPLQPLRGRDRRPAAGTRRTVRVEFRADPGNGPAAERGAGRVAMPPDGRSPLPDVLPVRA